MATSDVFTDGDFTLPVRTGRERITRPFSTEGDNDSRVIELDYIQKARYFQPAKMDQIIKPDYDLSTVIAYDFPVAYLVEESATEPVGYDLIKFTRTFAEIPKSRVIGESYAWRRPGISGGVLSNAVNITSASGLSGQTVLSVGSTAEFEVDDLVVIKYYVGWTQAGTNVFRYIQRRVISKTASTITVEIVNDPLGKVYFEWILKYSQYRDAETVETSSFVTIDYFLPGVSSGISSFRKIPIIPRDVIRDVDGKESETFANNSEPTQEDYLSDIKNQVLRVVSPSTIRRWRGNIYERQTRYVVSQ